MILRSETVDQAIDSGRVVRLHKDVVMTPGPAPLGMVRKHLPEGPRRGVVLLVHGFGQNRYAWHSSKRSLSTYLAASGWDVFNADLRGTGRSRRFGAQQAMWMTEHIHEDLPSCAREALRLSRAKRLFLVGHSMGGILSYVAAASVLRREVAGVATLGSPYRFGEGSNLLRVFSGALRGLRVTGVFDSNPTLPIRLVGNHLYKRRRVWDTRVIPFPIRPWMPGSIEDEVLDEYLSRAFDWTTLGIAFDIFRVGYGAMVKDRSDVRTAFEHLDKPLLVIAGSEDGLAPPSSVRPAYDRSRSRDKTYRVFPAGHADLVLGKASPTTIWPALLHWLDRRFGAGAQGAPGQAA